MLTEVLALTPRESSNMPLDEASQRFLFLLQGDLRRLSERRETRESSGHDLKYDSVARMATHVSRHGGVVERWYGEVLATYAPADRILRWSWAGKAPQSTSSYAEVIFREGQARGIPQLAMSMVADIDEKEADLLAHLGALVARAEGLHIRKHFRQGKDNLPRPGEIEFIGLFVRPRPADPDAPAGDRWSVPPPGPEERNPRDAVPPRAPYRSLPPITEVFEPRSRSSPPPPPVGLSASPKAPPVAREPARAIFLPVATGLLQMLARALPTFRQALLVLVVDADGRTERHRVFASLAVLDEAGTLRSMDVEETLLEAAATMVAADRRDGNAWRKLVTRVVPKPDGGATLHVEVD